MGRTSIFILTFLKEKVNRNLNTDSITLFHKHEKIDSTAQTNIHVSTSQNKDISLSYLPLKVVRMDCNISIL